MFQRGRHRSYARLQLPTNTSTAQVRGASLLIEILSTIGGRAVQNTSGQSGAGATV